MLRALALPALLAACAGTHAPPATTDASACRAPWAGPAKDRRFSPKPLASVPAPGRLASSDPAEAAYALARHEFAAAQWDRAATGFRALAFGSPQTDVGVYAAEMYLESLAMLVTHAERASCDDEIARDGPRLIALYCKDGGAADETGCTRLGQWMAEHGDARR